MYGLPPDPVVTTRDLPRMWKHAGLAAAGVGGHGGRRVPALPNGTAVSAGEAQPGPAQPDVAGNRARAGGQARPERPEWPDMAAAQNGGGRGEQFMVPRAEFRSYYGRPVIKEPVWQEPDVPGYLFFGGLAGASSVLAAAAQLTGRPRLARAAKAAGARRDQRVHGVPDQ